MKIFYKCIAYSKYSSTFAHQSITKKIIDMKIVNFYLAVSGYWIAEFSIKGKSKLRRMPCGNTNEELYKAILRYETKGYKVIIK